MLLSRTTLRRAAGAGLMNHACDVAFLDTGLLCLPGTVRHETFVSSRQFAGIHSMLLCIFNELIHHLRRVFVTGLDLWDDGNNPAGNLELKLLAGFDPGPLADALRHRDFSLQFECHGHRSSSLSVYGYGWPPSNVIPSRS